MACGPCPAKASSKDTREGHGRRGRGGLCGTGAGAEQQAQSLRPRGLQQPGHEPLTPPPPATPTMGSVFSLVPFCPLNSYSNLDPSHQADHPLPSPLSRTRTPSCFICEHPGPGDPGHARPGHAHGTCRPGSYLRATSALLLAPAWQRNLIQFNLDSKVTCSLLPRNGHFILIKEMETILT